jgi:hypothetical protein
MCTVLLILFRKDSRECVGGSEMKYDTTNAKGLKVMRRKNITMLVSFVLLAVVLSLPVAAQAQAYANSSSVFAFATGDGTYYIAASCRISNLLDDDGGVQQGNITYAEASGYASNLYNVKYYPVTSSRAYAYDGNKEILVYWPD